MTGIDIALIVIGAVLIVISYLVSEKITGEHKKDNNNVMEVWSNKDEMTVKDRVQLLVADKSEQIMDNAEERLCQISNNKIMEFQEYSDQILSKLEENHKQSVFLYNMLNEKQADMKEWMVQLDKRYAEIMDNLNAKEVIREAELETIKKESKETHEIKPVEKLQEKSELEVPVQQVTLQIGPSILDQSEAKERKTEPVMGKMGGRNEKILSLFNSGKSIVDISKQLGIGQGEVKLVIDLFKGANK